MTIAAAMLSSSAVHAQSGHKTPSLTEITPRSESSSLLLGRSEMQAPKPIPVIRPLRFQEIPASPEGKRGVEKQALDSLPAGGGTEKASEPALLVMPQTNVAQ
ncbi:MAG TPA: hypothetical protein VFA40_24170 [Terriglobales bacterium]|nr:hypothetical protein [Terriglobales bacterium]